MNRRTRSAVWIVVAVAGALSLPGPSFAKDPLRKIEKLVVQVEEVDDGERSSAGLPPDVKGRLDESRNELQGYLAEHPDDVEALLLAGRVERLRNLMSRIKWTSSSGWVKPTEPMLENASAHLDRALRLAPDRADLHFWQARVNGATKQVLDGDEVFDEPWRMDAAIDHAARAVELAPDEPGYRETWGLYLARDARFEEAESTFQPLEGGEHRARLLLRDLNAIPLPDAARYAPLRQQRRVREMAGAGAFYKHALAELHVRAFTFPGTAAEVAETLRHRWPAVSLFESPKDDGASPRIAGFNWSGDELTPTDAPKKAMKADVVVSVEAVEPSPAERQQYGGGGGAFSVIYLITSR